MLRSALYRKYVPQTPEAHYLRDQWGPRLVEGATGASLIFQNWSRFVEQMQLNACKVSVPRPSLHTTPHRSVIRECRHMTDPRSRAFGYFTRPLDVESLQESQEDMCQLNTSWSLVLIFDWEMFAMESRDTGLSIMGCCVNQKNDCGLQVL